MEKAKQSGCVLVAEAARPNGDLISARKGNAKYRITFHGKASHAGSALTEGVSAITELAHWVLAINEQVNLDTGTTMNVGVVQGTGVNVVPDFAEAIVDLRFWSNEEAAAVHERLTFMANNPFLAGCRVEVDRQSFKPAMRPSGDTDALMALVEAAAKEEDLLQLAGGRWRSDANFTAAAGVPSLDGFGPMGAVSTRGGVPAAGEHSAAHPPAAAGAGQAGQLALDDKQNGRPSPPVFICPVGAETSNRVESLPLILQQVGELLLTGNLPVAERQRRCKARAVGHHGVVLPCSPQASKPRLAASCCNSARVAASSVRPTHSGPAPGCRRRRGGRRCRGSAGLPAAPRGLLPERGVNGQIEWAAALADPVWRAPTLSMSPVTTPSRRHLFQCRQRRFITEIERRFDGDQQMGQTESRCLPTHL